MWFRFHWFKSSISLLYNNIMFNNIHHFPYYSIHNQVQPLLLMDVDGSISITNPTQIVGASSPSRPIESLHLQHPETSELSSELRDIFGSHTMVALHQFYDILILVDVIKDIQIQYQAIKFRFGSSWYRLETASASQSISSRASPGVDLSTSHLGLQNE